MYVAKYMCKNSSLRAVFATMLLVLLLHERRLLSLVIPDERRIQQYLVNTNSYRGNSDYSFVGSHGKQVRRTGCVQFKNTISSLER